MKLKFFAMAILCATFFCSHASSSSFGISFYYSEKIIKNDKKSPTKTFEDFNENNWRKQLTFFRRKHIHELRCSPLKGECLDCLNNIKPNMDKGKETSILYILESVKEEILRNHFACKENIQLRNNLAVAFLSESCKKVKKVLSCAGPDSYGLCNKENKENSVCNECVKKRTEAVMGKTVFGKSVFDMINGIKIVKNKKKFIAILKDYGIDTEIKIRKREQHVSRQNQKELLESLPKKDFRKIKPRRVVCSLM